jgi:dipeptidyl aminopeptidase/acylaminoacyl peptidase
VKPSSIADVRSVSDPRLHPDGERVAFTVAEVDLAEDRYVSRIWLWDGENARTFTHGPTDSSPRWSPDGTRLAFIRKGEDDDDQPQVAVMSVDGGEATIITELPLGVRELEWAPDSSRLCVVGVTWIDELADLDDDERERRPRRITHPQWRFDNQGWTHDRRAHLYLVDPDGEPGQEPVRLTTGEHDDSSLRWHPDGDRIGFLSARHDDRYLDPGNQAWTVSADGGEPEPLTDVGSWWGVSWRPDGVAHLVGMPDRWDWPGIARVWRKEPDGGLTDLTGHTDRSIAPYTPNCVPNEPHWIEGGAFLSLYEDRGRVHVISVDADGKIEHVLEGDRSITGIAPTSDGAAFAFTATDPVDPGELHWWDGGEEAVLTDVNAGARSDLAPVAPTYFTYERDGVEIDAWIYLPPGEETVPTLFNIHGGPASQYGWYFFDEFQVYAAAGYGVVATNPRGSSGRGVDWLRAVVGVWHEEEPVDVADLRAAIDAATAREPRLDPDRIGIMGGSYGGFVSGRILAIDDRFSSAVVERGLLTWASFAGTSDIGPYFDRMYLDAQLPDDHEILWQASPVAHAHRVTAPTLVLHSEADFRCPIEQAEQYFVALQRHGVESEFVRFPGESHELSRSGKPKHRIERFEAVLDWHGRYLGVTAPEDAWRERLDEDDGSG